MIEMEIGHNNNEIAIKPIDKKTGGSQSAFNVDKKTIEVPTRSRRTPKDRENLWVLIKSGDLYSAFNYAANAHSRLSIEEYNDNLALIHLKAHSGKFEGGPRVAYEISQHMIIIHRPSDPRDQERRAKWTKKYKSDMAWYAEDLNKQLWENSTKNGIDNLRAEQRNLAEHFNWIDYQNKEGQMKTDTPDYIQGLARTAIHIEIDHAPNDRLNGGLSCALHLAKETGIPGGDELVFKRSEEAQYGFNRTFWKVNKFLEKHNIPIRIPLTVLRP